MTDYTSLTSYIYALLTHPSGKWHEGPGQMPWFEYSTVVKYFIAAVYTFEKHNPNLELYNYQTILEQHLLKLDWNVLESVDVSNLDGQTVLALIVGVIRIDGFNKGTLKDLIDNGCMVKWLKRLRDIDDIKYGL